ncbi:hypothetical protein HRR81_001221 [Exophiala dermatitidis]|nr:hypothetical protein HRR74_004043 [Exophiala dermatitidis]KAJ4529118.1 hypothetical protein HRR73_000138 [Exophiala dermatitidis]KAJ4561655.1 hypothetical protein HRR79_006992 [Exophiala dermatitidis]KAJ4582495.1 hypothetical protein HRR81_001221 [Exophiala dermatitidis]KAJ4680095.1 hypothetical protein HRR95_003814 [Exophiala dermatitidis]
MGEIWLAVGDKRGKVSRKGVEDRTGSRETRDKMQVGSGQNVACLTGTCWCCIRRASESQFSSCSEVRDSLQSSCSAGAAKASLLVGWAAASCGAGQKQGSRNLSLKRNGPGHFVTASRNGLSSACYLYVVGFTV